TLYRNAEIIILPSVCEGFGLPILEAMYCGKPVVASRIPTSLEVAGRAACFFSLDDSEEFFQAVRDALELVGSRSYKLVASRQLKLYSWEKLVLKYEEIYRMARASR
ncbi:MAG: glycosyltransferase, partial [Ignavibacteriae bacterium]|nr:glycosyltransferase [Ignavibacteriota bacterium]